MVVTATSVTTIKLSHYARRTELLGWVTGIEPATTGATVPCSNQLSYTHH